MEQPVRSPDGRGAWAGHQWQPTRHRPAWATVVDIIFLVIGPILAYIGFMGLVDNVQLHDGAAILGSSVLLLVGTAFILGGVRAATQKRTR